jgi:hypothetical protein
MNNLTILICILMMGSVSCHDEVSPGREALIGDYMSQIYPENFVSRVTNSYLPLTPGSTFRFRAETSKGSEIGEIEILKETKIILGITCTVVKDRVYLNSQLIEDTYDWFAQDKNGNVWYMGEKVDNYVNGVIDNHYGSWEAGVDGAEPGIMMAAVPSPGLHYRQEHYLSQAEDQAQIIGNNHAITVPAGTFNNCIKIRETNPLDPSLLEYKYYASGVGLVKVEKIADPVEIEELQSYEIK